MLIIAKGDRVRGSYMGQKFEGVVVDIESDSSGHPGTQYHGRAYIEIAHDMRYREAGDCLIALGELRRGKFTAELGLMFDDIQKI